MSKLGLLYNVPKYLVRVVFGVKVRREICCLHPAEADLGMPTVEMRQYRLCIRSLDRMRSQNDSNDEF